MLGIGVDHRDTQHHHHEAVLHNVKVEFSFHHFYGSFLSLKLQQRRDLTEVRVPEARVPGSVTVFTVAAAVFLSQILGVKLHEFARARR